jgi:hypothetical protein
MIGSKNVQDLVPVLHEDVEYKWEAPKGDFIVKVQPRIAKTINLCGYEIDFLRKRNPDTGQWVYPIYVFDSRKFPPRNGDKEIKSVLPEILIKLTNPISPCVDIRNTETIRVEKTEKPKTKRKV